MVLVQAVVLMGWWLYQSIDFGDLAGSFTPFSSFNAGTLLIQWGIALAAFLALNAWLVDRARPGPLDQDGTA
jgi:neurotransmitter:Na+ symporter, NSS family